MKNKYYALYKGDTFIDIGTIQELADKLGVTKKTIKYYGTPAYKKKFKEDNNRIIVIKIEEDNE